MSVRNMARVSLARVSCMGVLLCLVGSAPLASAQSDPAAEAVSEETAAPTPAIPEPVFDLPDPGDVEERPALIEAASDEAAEVDIDFATVLGYGGLVGYAIVALSVVALALAGLFFFELRPGTLMPSGVYDAIRGELKKGGTDAALARGKKETSFLGHVLCAGLDALRDGRAEARAVMADAADTWMAGSVRRIEYLNLIATVSPMLGLLGTVVGMVKTFAALAQSTGPVDPVELSAGIFQALVTTMMGLAVAIPTLLLYTVLRNRADHIQTTVVSAGEQLVSGLSVEERGTTGS